MSKAFLRSWISKTTKWAEVYAWVKKIPESDVPQITQGRLGEILVSYYLFGEDRLNWNISFPGDDGHHDLLYKGKKIDVKTSRFFKNVQLKEFYSQRKKDSNMYYCLVSLDLEKEKYKIQGFINAVEFTSEKYLVEDWMGKGRRYIAEASDLSFDILENTEVLAA